jgi:RNA polymerase sigma-70 factor (ECF subfamily)
MEQAVGPGVQSISEPDSRLPWLIKTEYLFVWRALRRFGVQESDAEDAAQQVFMVAARKLEKIEPNRERAFLFATALRVARNERRRAARRPREDLELHEPMTDEPAADDLLEQARSRRVLDSILNRLSERLRAVFILYEIEDLTMAEIAVVLAISSGTVASRLRRARRRFAQEVARERRCQERLAGAR